ncbi:MAG: hypothetical protein AAF581_10245 [Planctomycetota bacterium]
MWSQEYELFADYSQFYLQDEASDGDLSDSWTDDAVQQLLAVAPGVVGVGTARNCDVPVLVEVHATAPDLDADDWDHVTECGLSVTSERIVIAGCTDYFPDAARIPVQSGDYAVRVSYGGLASVSADGLDGADRYRVQLWPGPLTEPRVVKQRS